jgi:uncharacterized membrane protein YfcA
VDLAHLALISLAAVAGGAINAIAGGGSLITFPALLAAGVPAVVASMTNTVAMCPGYFSGTFAQRIDLAGQRSRAAVLVPAALAGSVGGAYILLHTTERAFQTIVPGLLVFAAVLLALQPRLKRWIAARGPGARSLGLAVVPVAVAAIYGAYFGAGLGVILISVIAVVVDDTLVRANALKQLLSLAINTCAAIVFVAVGHVEWRAAAALAVGSLAGGFIGGKLVRRVPEAALRAVVIAAALVLAVIYFARQR